MTTESNANRNELEAAEWSEKYWNDGKSPWHETEVDKHLKKFAFEFFNNRENMTVFVPLCGKSIDMKWLLLQGHSVIGVEFSKVAIQEFQDEQGIKLNFNECPEIDGAIYESEDHKLKIFCCDLYKINSDIIGKVDAVFDRGSFEAINVRDRVKYCKLVMDVCKTGATMLLCVTEYNPEQYQGPPHTLFKEDINKYYGESYTVKSLERTEETGRALGLMGVDSLHIVAYLLTKK